MRKQTETSEKEKSSSGQRGAGKKVKGPEFDCSSRGKNGFSYKTFSARRDTHRLVENEASART